MSYLGIENGMRIYQYIEDVPDSIIESGQNFVVMDPPQEMIDHNAMVMTRGSGLGIGIWLTLKIALYCVLVIVTGYVLVNILMQTGYIIHGRPGQKIDKNLFEAGDGSVWCRDPETGKWRMCKAAPLNPILIIGIAVIAIFIIGIVILILLNRKKLSGSFEGGKSGSAGSTKKKKDNPNPPEE